MEKMQIGNRSSAVGRASLGLQHTVVKVFISKFKFIRDMLDDPSFQQSLSVFHRFPAVWCQSNLNKPAHQIGAAEDAPGCPGTTPSLPDNVPDAQVFVVMHKLVAGQSDFLGKPGLLSHHILFSAIPEDLKPFLAWKYNQVFIQPKNGKGQETLTKVKHSAKKLKFHIKSPGFWIEKPPEATGHICKEPHDEEQAKQYMSRYLSVRAVELVLLFLGQGASLGVAAT